MLSMTFIERLQLSVSIYAPVCCDGIGGLTFNQVSQDSRVRFPSGVLII